jgi:hypothetical protein
VIRRDRLLTVPYTAELRDGAQVDITQTDTAENDTASPRFDDNFDAYQWLHTGELSTWPEPHWADMTRSTSSHPDLCTAELAEHQDRGRSLTQRWPRYGRTSSVHRQLGNTTH